MKNFIFIFLLNVVFSKLPAQGINLYAGTSSAKGSHFSSELAQTGYMFGADARLNEGKMYFNVGLQYHQISINPRSSFKLNPDSKFNFTKIRAGLGYDLIHISDDSKVRGKSLGSLDIISGIPKNNNVLYNDAVVGVALGLGFDIHSITFDVELEIGLVNAIENIEQSKYDFINFMIGFIF